jgi:hypothetical protein
MLKGEFHAEEDSLRASVRLHFLHRFFRSGG